MSDHPAAGDGLKQPVGSIGTDRPQLFAALPILPAG